LPSQAGYLASQYQERHQVTNQPKTVKSILTKAGFRRNKQGYYALKGKVVKFSMEDPIAYSDYYGRHSIMSSN